MSDDKTTFPTLLTHRLTLRQLSKSDAEAIFKLRSDTEINKYLDRRRCESLEDAAAFIDNINENIKTDGFYYWAISRIGNESLIGTICLFDLDAERTKCEIGYELLTEFQGSGIMLEAAKKVVEYARETIGVSRIDAVTHPQNHSSTKLLQKLNFEKLATTEQSSDLMLFRLVTR